MVLSFKLRNALKKFAVKILDVDNTKLPKNHLALLNDFKTTALFLRIVS